jgi:hypothetical protein
MNYKKQDTIKITGPNGLRIERDKILKILLNDKIIFKLLGGKHSANYEYLYWDDIDLVSTYYNNKTIVTISYDQPQTIGDLKKNIIDFCAKNMTFEQRQKIALKVFNKICGNYANNADVCLSNDIIIINGAPLFFNDILDYYNRLQEIKK